MSDFLTVRPALPRELPEVGQLTLRAYLADGMVTSGSRYAADLADAAGRARQAELLVAAEPDGTLRGTITVCPPGSPLREISQLGELEFRMLAVAPEARRRGVGATLVTAVLKRAAELGAHQVVLSSAQRMHAAHQLYARLGFIRLPERDWQPVPGLQLLAFGLMRPPGELIQPPDELRRG